MSMAKTYMVFYTIICVIVILSRSITCSSRISNSKADEERKEYIVYMGALREGVDYSTNEEHLTLLSSVVGETISASDSLVRSYRRSFNGLAAKLTAAEAHKLASKEGIVSVFPSQTLQLQTTRSWDFLGLPVKAERRKQIESDVIIGVIDTGVWPELDSFSDEGFGPPPKKWKGSCNGGVNFTCNNKVIGARYYAPEMLSARDIHGHGSHTASTAAGNPVEGASFYGLAKGTITGGVPSSRIATYSVCTIDRYVACRDRDVLAAFDDAIADGVDIINISMGGGLFHGLYTNVIAIGSFHAMEKGIVTVQAVGNSGPYPGSVDSLAPWLFSVGATTVDRKFIDKIVIGNGSSTYTGSAINTFPASTKSVPLVHGENIAKNITGCAGKYANNCAPECLDEKKVKGKIVLCNQVIKADTEVARSGALGAVVRLDSDTLPLEAPFFPVSGSVFTGQDYDSIMVYYANSTNPQGRILQSEAIVDKSAPKIAEFSSRGPNLLLYEILKPDISAPGVNILAGFTPLNPPSGKYTDKRRSNVTFMTGTSMACAHASGVAAYVKSFHPTWSPSAIKSAIMTSATEMVGRKEKGMVPEFSFGSGLINPIRAVNPGLVYEIEKLDYYKFVCRSGYEINYPRGVCVGPAELNYPNLMFQVGLPNRPFTMSLNRTVTNVGPAKSSYKAKIVYSETTVPVTVEVIPSVLSFSSVNEKQTFTVKVTGKNGMPEYTSQYSMKLSWSDGNITVNSVIIVYTSP